VKLPVQPAGTALVRSKTADGQLLLLLVTEALNETCVPAATAGPVAGERLTVGLASVQMGLATT
jgi:hypothetical protein